MGDGRVMSLLVRYFVVVQWTMGSVRPLRLYIIKLMKKASFFSYFLKVSLQRKGCTSVKGDGGGSYTV